MFILFYNLFSQLFFKFFYNWFHNYTLWYMVQGNKPVCTSADEYSIAVNSTRGLKEFQYDQIFMENSTQEKIFEDANVKNYFPLWYLPNSNCSINVAMLRGVICNGSDLRCFRIFFI